MNPNWVNSKGAAGGGGAVGHYKLEGLAELLRNIEQFPKKIQRKIINGALKDSSKVVVAAVRAKAPARTGVLRRSVRATTVRAGRRGPVLLIAIGGKRTRTNRRTKMKITDDAFYAPWVEFGTEKHEITTRFGTKSLSFGGRLYKKVTHPGARATHFFERGIDVSAGAATSTFVQRVRERLAAVRSAQNL